MALIKCPECGKEFSDKAPACPNCGCPISEIENSNKNYKDFDSVFLCNKTLKKMNIGAIKETKKILGIHENVLFSSVLNISINPIMAKLSDSFSVKGKKNGVFTITNKRVVFVNSSLGIGETKQITKDQITSVDTRKTLMNCPVRIVGLTEMFVVDCDKQMQEKIMEALSNMGVR